MPAPRWACSVPPWGRRWAWAPGRLENIYWCLKPETGPLSRARACCSPRCRICPMADRTREKEPWGEGWLPRTYGKLEPM
eukprot:9692656-Lingulodinium_polyedra.AAC.1